jgi:hypothetical protein
MSCYEGCETLPAKVQSVDVFRMPERDNSDQNVQLNIRDASNRYDRH